MIEYKKPSSVRHSLKISTKFWSFPDYLWFFLHCSELKSKKWLISPLTNIELELLEFLLFTIAVKWRAYRLHQRRLQYRYHRDYRVQWWRARLSRGKKQLATGEAPIKSFYYDKRIQTWESRWPAVHEYTFGRKREKEIKKSNCIW